MNKYSLSILSLSGGILCGLAWTGWCTGLILLFAFVPFFIIEEYIYKHRKKFTQNAFFILITPGFVLFSIISMGWMRVASLTGAVCVILGLSFCMSFTMWLAHFVRTRLGNIAGIIAMIIFWLGYEYITLNVNIISPWLNLGNGLSKDILFIQWYEITGTGGGTLWILLSNIFLTIFLLNFFTGKRTAMLYLSIWLTIIILPAVFSVYRYNTIDNSNKNATEVVIIQPNIDPYTEKFSIPFEDQLNKTLKMASERISGTTGWLITPETTIDDPINLSDLAGDKYIKKIRELCFFHPDLNVVTGMVTFMKYPPSETAPTPSARRIDKTGQFYDHFNSAVKIDSVGSFGVYHKSKLVPGIEMQFSTGPGRLIARILPNLGGTRWGYGMQKDRTCLTHSVLPMRIAPVICYESVFGNFVAGFVRNGANAIFIITNDGWWKNTGGYKQHLNFASLRAIETRRQIARSANTGISCIIDILGRRTFETDWWKPAVITGEISNETTITPYVRFGDYLQKISGILSLLAIMVVLVISFIKKKQISGSGNATLE